MNDRSDNTPVPAPTKRSLWRGLTIWLGSLLILAATLGALGFLGWKKYQEIQAAMNVPPPPEMPTAVGIRDVGTIQWRNSTSSIGTILAPRSITVNNETPGTVSQIFFEMGQVVEEGAPLLQLDTSVEQAQLKAAIAREDFARATHERNLEISKRNAVSASELEGFESQWRQAQAEVEELRALIARKAIAAPFRARVGLSNVHQGQYLAPGSLITTLQSIEDHLLVEFTLAQSITSQLQPQDQVTVVFESRSLKATVSAIDAQADRLTRHFRVRARIDELPPRMKPGDSVSVKVAYGPELSLPAVPAESIRRSPQGTFVYIAEKTSADELRASARTVVLATSVGSQVGIARGVAPGEQVAVEGSFKLHEGALLVPADTAPKSENK